MSSVGLESLDNKSLRAKCLEYGLPNVPITDTSRKILIRKLRATMDGTTNDKTKSTRRETINTTQTTKSSTPKKETPKKVVTNNRRTIAAVRDNETVHTPVPIALKQVTQRRQSNRGTPIIQERIIPVTVERRHVSQPIFEENNSEDDFILIDDETPENYALPTQSQPFTSFRKSRSPSLGKSATITTSYKKELSQQQKPIPEDESESEEEQTSPIGRTRIINHDISPIAHKINDIYDIPTSFIPNVPIESPKVPRYGQPSTYLHRTSIEKEEEYPVGYKSLYPTLNSVVPDGTKYSYENQATRRYTTSGITQPKLSKYNTSAATSKRISTPQQYTENSDTNGDDDIEQDEETPYLSDFARRLTRLKAEPLDIGYKKDLSELREHRYGNSPVGIRRSNYSARRNSTVADSFKEFWFALDHKYKIMKKLIILLIISIIILSIYIYSNYNH